MTASLRDEAARHPVKRVLVVIGAGHLQGIGRELVTQIEPAQPLREKLSVLPPASPWPKWIAIGLLAIVAIAIAVAFSRGATLGADALRDWVLFTGGFSALGALAGGGHPLSVLVAFIVGPLKPFRPGVPSGAVSAATELWLHRPRVADFDTLRDDVIHWTGWWRNRVSRTLLVFMLTCLGTIIGEYIAAFHIVKSLF